MSGQVGRVVNRSGRTVGDAHAVDVARDQSGQSVLELAILLPFMALLLLGVVDVGRIFYLTLELNGAARAGVQYGAQNPATAVDDAGMVQAAQREAQDVLGTWWGSPSNFVATSTHVCQCSDGVGTACSAGACRTPQYIFVQVDSSAEFRPLFRYLGLPSSITLRGKAIMRVSNG
jgi:Flp pilus assembly protein TadG